LYEPRIWGIKVCAATVAQGGAFFHFLVAGGVWTGQLPRHSVVIGVRLPHLSVYSQDGLLVRVVFLLVTGKIIRV